VDPLVYEKLGKIEQTALAAHNRVDRQETLYRQDMANIYNEIKDVRSMLVKVVKYQDKQAGVLQTLRTIIAGLLFVLGVFASNLIKIWFFS